jgi:hypothetical protein
MRSAVRPFGATTLSSSSRGWRGASTEAMPCVAEKAIQPKVMVNSASSRPCSGVEVSFPKTRVISA